jgi:hypothetical protein
VIVKNREHHPAEDAMKLIFAEDIAKESSHVARGIPEGTAAECAQDEVRMVMSGCNA